MHRFLHSCLQLAALAAATAIVAGCASNVRLEVEHGRTFELLDTAPVAVRDPLVPVSTPAPEIKVDVKVADGRSNVRRERLTAPLRVVLGESDLSPSPASAVAAEIARVAAGYSSEAAKARSLAARDLALDEFVVTIVAADVTKPKIQTPSGVQPPAVEAIGVGAAALGQALLGGSDVEVKLALRVDGRRVEGVGEGRYTATPGAGATVRPFRRAVLAAINSAAENAPAR